MQFIVIGKDGTDEEALSRRMAERDKHLKLCAESLASGNQLLGAALLDDAGNMTGSLMVMDFESRAALDEWLAREPYISGKVWQEIDVIPCRVGDIFSHCFPQKKQA